MVSTGEISADLVLYDKTAQGLAAATNTVRGAENALASAGTKAGASYSKALATSIKNSTASIQASLSGTLGNAGALALKTGWAGAAVTGGASAALSSAGIESASTFASFDDQMRRVQAVTEASDEQFKRLTSTARELGSTTSFSAQEAAEAMTLLGQAGFSSTQIISAMPATLNLARASMTDLSTTADIMSSIMRGFQIPAENTAYAADVLAMAANKTNTDVRGLGEAMKYVAPLAYDMGWSLEETAAYAGMLSDAGIKGSMAGTVLRNSISRLIDPTREVQNIFSRYGITLASISPETHTFSQILDTLSAAGVSTGEMMSIFGMRAGPGTKALLNQGTGAIREMITELQNSQGYAAQAADAMDAGFGGAVREAGHALEAMKISLGQAVATVGTPLLNVFSMIARSVSELPQPILVAVAAIGALSAVGLAALSVISIAGIMLPGLVTGLTALGVVEAGATLTTAGLAAAIWAALAPVAAVVVGVGLLVAALYILDQKTGIITYSWNLMKDIFIIVADGIMRAAGILHDYVVEKIDGIKQAIADMLPPGVVEGIKRGIDGITSQFTNLGDKVHEQALKVSESNKDIESSTTDAGWGVYDAAGQITESYGGIGNSALLAGADVTSATDQIVSGNLAAGESALLAGTETQTATTWMSLGLLQVANDSGIMVNAVKSTVNPVEALKMAISNATSANQTYAASFIDVSNMASAAASATISAASKIGSAIKTSVAQVGELEALAGKWNTRAAIGITSSGGSGTGEGNVKVVDKTGQYAAPVTRSGGSGTGETNVKINTVNNYGSSTSKSQLKKAGVSS